MAAAAPGLRPDPSFLRLRQARARATGRRQVPRGPRAPGWRAAAASSPARPGPRGLRPEKASAPPPPSPAGGNPQALAPRSAEVPDPVDGSGGHACGGPLSEAERSGGRNPGLGAGRKAGLRIQGRAGRVARGQLSGVSLPKPTGGQTRPDEERFCCTKAPIPNSALDVLVALDAWSFQPAPSRPRGSLAREEGQREGAEPLLPMG